MYTYKKNQYIQSNLLIIECLFCTFLYIAEKLFIAISCVNKKSCNFFPQPFFHYRCKYWPSKHQIQHCSTASWIPNSDEFFTTRFPNKPKELALTTRKMQVFDKNMDIYYEIEDEKFVAGPTVHLFHPYRPALATGNAKGRLNVLT